MKEILPKIYLLKFKTKYDLSSTFMRFQEHYESPVFRNKVFTRKEYLDWYGKKGKSYYKDWTGFNIPSYILDPFKKGDFDPLTMKEKRLLKQFSQKKGKFYIIGIFGKGRSLKHEIAHGLFYTNASYKRKVMAVLNSMPASAKNQVYKYLKSHGYDKSVQVDELHAYTLTDSKKFKNLKKYSKKLDEIIVSYQLQD